jgi:xanthine dehydrogenase YagT iron-sulfur-binding subunit
MGNEDDDLSRREFIGSAIAAGGAIGLALDPTYADETAPPTVPISLNVNGRDHRVSLDPRVTLLDALRHHLQLTGTKKGCDHGQCGACTVLVNGRRIYSCLALAVMQAGARITTIEGIAEGDRLHPVQQAFVEHDAFQCGYCTSGQICSAVGLLTEGHAKTDNEVRELMSGNICRCGAYPNIVAAIQDARTKSA